jgi:hypothetical protein
MKTIKYILGTLVIAASLSACVKDLDVIPIDPNANTADKALVDEAAFQSLLAGVYTGYACPGYYGKDGSPSLSGLDGGASQYIRGLYNLNELTTDESMISWNDQTIKNFHWMNWTTDDSFIYSFYSRIFLQVSFANEFIREAKASSVEFAKKNEYIAEARVLRALAYYHAIDNFGNVPFADETSIVGQNPDQITRAKLYEWLEKELTDLIDGNDLAAPRANGYARADKGVAKFLLAKLYLNAEVYTGTAQWQKCADVLKDLMDDGYSLHTTSKGNYSAYQELFLADNEKCTDEIIFAVEQDGVNTTSYGATNYIIFGSTIGDNPTMNPDEIGITSGWSGIHMTPEFYDKFSKDDARYLFHTEGQSRDVIDLMAADGLNLQGYAFKKFLNRTSDGGFGKEKGSVDTDFPMMRYADVLLMAAECQAHNANIDGVSAFNQVRTRAGMPTVSTLSLSEIIDERARELYQECWRRSDLIRFGLFTSGDYLWQWKGNVFEGRAVDAGRSLFPIPDSDLLANTKLQQNEYYK